MTTNKYVEEISGERNLDSRWRCQRKTELDGDKWYVVRAVVGGTRHKSCELLESFMCDRRFVAAIFHILADACRCS